MLELSRQNQIYGSTSKVSVKDIIQKELDASLAANHGHITVDHELNLAASYREREFIVQYNETDLAFLSRWCESNGIFFFFTQGEQGETVVFGDTNVAFAEVDALPYRHGHDAITTSQAAVTSFGFTRPAGDAVGRAARIQPREAGPAAALEGRCRRRQDRHGHRIRPAFPRAGRRRLSGQGPGRGDRLPRQGFPGREQRAAAAAGRLLQPDGSSLAGGSLSRHRRRARVSTPSPVGYGGEEATASPMATASRRSRSAVPFRPERRTPKPLAAGLFNAFVDGEADGSRAEVDTQGRYKRAAALMTRATAPTARRANFCARPSPMPALRYRHAFPAAQGHRGRT